MVFALAKFVKRSMTLPTSNSAYLWKRPACLFCVPLFARHSMRSSLVLPSGTDDLFMFHSPQSFSTSDFHVSLFGPLAVSLTYLF